MRLQKYWLWFVLWIWLCLPAWQPHDGLFHAPLHSSGQWSDSVFLINIASAFWENCCSSIVLAVLLPSLVFCLPPSYSMHFLASEWKQGWNTSYQKLTSLNPQRWSTFALWQAYLVEIRLFQRQATLQLKFCDDDLPPAFDSTLLTDTVHGPAQKLWSNRCFISENLKVCGKEW